MDGHQLVASLKRMSEIEDVKQITHLTHALFPGTHCPLMGAALVIRGIQDAMMMVVGTDECAYYTKSLTLNGDSFGGLSGRCVSVVLDSGDVTFGSRKRVVSAFQEMVEDYHPKVVFLVTTCVVEIIGDDMDAIADELSEQYDIAVMAVHTEHFKCENHLPGITRTLEACVDMMKPQPKGQQVNVLGQRMGSFAGTELYHILQQSGVDIGLQVPSNCSVGEIRVAAGAKANIVVNSTALPMAKKMKRKFGIPYIVFEKFVAPQRIYQAYVQLFEALGHPLPKAVEDKYQRAIKQTNQARAGVQGLRYIYGNTPYPLFEFNRFLVDLGMVPLVIQTADLPEEDQEDRAYIQAKHDPYLVLPANIAPLQFVYDVLQPNLYLGHEYAHRLRKKNIALVRSDQAASMLGFEITHYALSSLQTAADELQQMHHAAERSPA
ncbi:MAG: nitrogenase component 1 [Christensenellales bacterium]|jgi:nitrogenase molybdenum-cofactor synthesis protein NifE